MVQSMKAYRIACAIRFNVDEYYLELVTFERFSRRNARLWNRARLAGVEDAVTLAVRPRVA